MKKASLLLIEDDPAIAASLQSLLAEEGYEVAHVSRGDAGLARAREGGFEVVLSDVKLPGLNGLELVRDLHRVLPRLPIILMTAHGTTDTAIEAMKWGAYEYVLKPFEIPDLLELLARALASSRMMSEPVELGLPNPGRTALIGDSRAMQEVFKEIGRLAAKPVTVLIRGETGTGKELVARALYHYSDRADKPFVAVNCAAIPETLLESELFGHERGAFTGAESRRIGRFEQAHSGTVFLDEIGDMTLGTQAKLLRVLQERTIQRLGGKETIAVDVRVLAATHRDLETALEDRQFREDLYYRLNVATLFLPPLRERLDDLEPLARYFLSRYGPELGHPQPGMQPNTVDRLRAHSWLGNVRELENVIRKALLQAQGYPLTTEHIDAALGTNPRAGPGPLNSRTQSIPQAVAELLAAAQRGDLNDARQRLVLEVDRELVTQAIRLAGGNQAKAARWLGITRLTLREKLDQFEIPLHHPGDPSARP